MEVRRYWGQFTLKNIRTGCSAYSLDYTYTCSTVYNGFTYSRPIPYSTGMSFPLGQSVFSVDFGDFSEPKGKTQSVLQPNLLFQKPQRQLAVLVLDDASFPPLFKTFTPFTNESLLYHHHASYMMHGAVRPSLRVETRSSIVFDVLTAVSIVQSKAG